MYLSTQTIAGFLLCCLTVIVGSLVVVAHQSGMVDRLDPSLAVGVALGLMFLAGLVAGSTAAFLWLNLRIGRDKRGHSAP